MKKKRLSLIVLTLAALLAFLLFYPVYEGLRYKVSEAETVANLRYISFILRDYAKTHNEYPKSLEAISSKEYFKQNDIPHAYLNQLDTLYIRPLSMDVQNDFIILARPTLSGLVIVNKDCSVKVIRYNKP